MVDIFHTMKQFFKTIGYNDYERLLSEIEPISSTKTMATKDSLNFVASQNVLAPENVPGFTRSTVDGYAVLSKDTEGASPSIPSILSIVGEIKMGEKPETSIKSGEAVKIYTGGALPEGADSVVMFEFTNEIQNELEVYKPVSSGENTIREDEDFKKGEIIVKKGDFLTVQKVQALLSAGVLKINVFEKLRIGVISTGDEIIEPSQPKKIYQIRDTNSFVIKSFLENLKENVEFLGIVKDNKKELLKKIEDNYEKHDLFLISGGSSMGTRDITEEVLKEFGEILFHGIRISPGKPLIFAKEDKKFFLGLPGHPVSSFVSVHTIVKPLILRLEGGVDFKIIPDGMVEVSRNIPSKPGRESFVPVKLGEKENKIFAHPLLGESGLISIIKDSDGFIRIPENEEGVYKGEYVRFYKI